MKIKNPQENKKKIKIKIENPREIYDSDKKC